MTVDKIDLGKGIHAEITPAGVQFTIRDESGETNILLLSEFAWAELEQFVNAWKDAKQAERLSAPTHGVDIMTYEDRRRWSE